MDRDDLQLIFVGISALTGLILVLFRISSSESNYLNWIPSIFRGWVGTALLTLIGVYLGWQILRVLWPSGDEDDEGWYDEVERTANGIQRAWHYSGARPEEKDRKRTAEEMDELTDDLKTYRRHQNATDEMAEKMNDIIEFWDDSRDLILSYSGSNPYKMRGLDFSDEADELKTILDKERQGRLRRFLSHLRVKLQNGRKWVGERIHEHRSIPLSYPVYREVRNHLSRGQVSEFIEGDCFLTVQGDGTWEAIYYHKNSDKYHPLHIDYDHKGDLTVIGKLPGLTLTDHQMKLRLQNQDEIDTIPYDSLVPGDMTFREFENSDTT